MTAIDALPAAEQQRRIAFGNLRKAQRQAEVRVLSLATTMADVRVIPELLLPELREAVADLKSADAKLEEFCRAKETTKL